MNNKITRFQDLSTAQIQSVNELREAVELPPIVIKKRVCLNCSQTFISLGSQNRICDCCKEK